MLALILIVAALVLFIIGAVGWPAAKFGVECAGLACLTAAYLLMRHGL